jgi:glycosyltransferase involved in cell wall biosynthesis
MPAEESPRLSVVLSTLGNYAVLRRVLDGYSAQDAPAGSFEVLVAADRADPDPGAVDAAIGAREYPVRRPPGRIPGLSANRNAGWRAAQAALVLFTDNDTIPVPRLVSEHLRWHERNPEESVGVLGHVRWAPELRVTPFMHWLDHGIQFDYHRIAGDDAGPGRFYGANASLKKAFLERVGDFEEERLPYGYEDIEWSHRASRHGFRLLYARDAVVDHLRPMTLRFWKKRARRLGAAERRMVEIHPDMTPSLLRMFEEAAARPPARGRGVRLYPWLPRRLPWIGPRVHVSADLAFKQALAPEFLAGWASAADAGPGPARPEVAELSE